MFAIGYDLWASSLRSKKPPTGRAFHSWHYIVFIATTRSVFTWKGHIELRHMCAHTHICKHDNALWNAPPTPPPSPREISLGGLCGWADADHGSQLTGSLHGTRMIAGADLRRSSWSRAFIFTRTFSLCLRIAIIIISSGWNYWLLKLSLPN